MRGNKAPRRAGPGGAPLRPAPPWAGSQRAPTAVAELGCRRRGAAGRAALSLPAGDKADRGDKGGDCGRAIRGRDGGRERARGTGAGSHSGCRRVAVRGSGGLALPAGGRRSGCGGVRDGRGRAGRLAGLRAAPQAIKRCWEPGAGVRVDIALRNGSAGMSFPEAHMSDGKACSWCGVSFQPHYL
ncbi:collagen alpha-1(I) chain-like isoform X2 [Motacilla alba alba]|uniref:collagen alpha-1(I) chain-like isoform X2 n=1 Tax=Motacilla alba alba TaxID=1094192 RepID=UPI0018D5A557|nr:collagen alpha-1(I) chain-like isoform X2 [Motacilla alba alba]